MTVPHVTVSKVGSPFNALCNHMSGHDGQIFHFISQQSEGLLTGTTPSKVTPSDPQRSTQSAEAMQSKQTIQPQLKHLKSTQARPWTPPQPALPLTAALTALSYSLAELEFSADGDEAELGPEVTEIPDAVPTLPLTTPGKTVKVLLQRPRTVQPRDWSGTTANNHMTTCDDQPCFPGVPCQHAADGGLRCGRCPVGYTGDGQTCRGMAFHSLSRRQFWMKVTLN